MDAYKHDCRMEPFLAGCGTTYKRSKHGSSLVGNICDARFVEKFVSLVDMIRFSKLSSDGRVSAHPK
eukprot:scaffold867_cov317-Pavlova_lutheri.AAC.41